MRGLHRRGNQDPPQRNPCRGMSHVEAPPGRCPPSFLEWLVGAVGSRLFLDLSLIRFQCEKDAGCSRWLSLSCSTQGIRNLLLFVLCFFMRDNPSPQAPELVLVRSMSHLFSWLVVYSSTTATSVYMYLETCDMYV